jgi:YesN/AraC family two-component response regulator
LAHYTVLKYTNPSGAFYLSQRRVSGPASMGGHHFHTNYEIFYLVEGERLYFIKDRTYQVNKGDLIFIKPYDLHTTQDTERLDHERILIKFNKDFIINPSTPELEAFDLLFEEHNHIHFSPLAQITIDSIYDKMLQEIRNQNIDAENCLHSLFLQLLIYSAREVKQNPNTEYKPLNQTHGKVLEIVSHINQNYHQKLTLGAIAALFHYSPYHLSRIFKEITGFTFTDYLNNLRVTKAQKLLEEPSLSIIAIAHLVGYENQSHFGRIFKGVTQISPLQYRKQLGNPNRPTTFKKQLSIEE